MAETPYQEVDVVESQGISWGKWILGGAAILGAALVAPAVLDSIGNAEFLTKDAGFLGDVAETARGWSQSLSSNYASAASSIGIEKVANNPINAEYFKDVLGDKSLMSVLGQGGSNAMDYVGDHKTATALTAGAAALGSLAILGPHTKRIVVSRAEPGIPVGQSVG